MDGRSPTARRRHALSAARGLTTWQRTQWAFTAAFALLLLGLALLQPHGNAGLRVAFTQEPLPALCAQRRAGAMACSGCGLTRGMVAALRLDLDAARGYHAAALPLAALLVAQLALRPLLARLTLRGARPLLFGMLDFSVHAALAGNLLVR